MVVDEGPGGVALVLVGVLGVLVTLAHLVRSVPDPLAIVLGGR